MDAIDYFFRDFQQSLMKFELGKVYSNPYARSFNSLTEAKAKKLRIFDFDDTLAKVKSNIIVKNNGKETILTPAQFAVYNPKQGDVFDFREFNQIIKTAAPVKTNIELLKQAASDPMAETTILTARLLGFPVKKYLKKNFGLDVYVIALGNANPQLKANYIEKEIKKGYTDIVFIDDSIKNVQAVEALKAKYPDVSLEAVHTTDAEHINI